MAVLTHREKRILLGIGTAAVLLVLFFVFSGQQQDTQKETEILQPASEDRVIEGSRDEVLAAFPENFPVEESARESESYQFIPAGSNQQQSTLTYTSQKSLSENAETFKTYLSENNFELINELAEDDLVFYYGQTADADLSVTIEEASGGVTVSVSYLKR